MAMTSFGLFALAALAAPAAAPVDYARQVKPILKERCCACHGALKQKARLRLDTAAAILKGGSHGPAAVPGDAAKSLLLQRLSGADGERMPPEGPPLSEGQVAVLKAWIEQGAAHPADEKPEADPREHWAFRGPVRPAVPAPKDAVWGSNPIDAFVAADHERRGVRPVGEASRAVWLRRVTLDLTGLPPGRDQLAAFLADPSPDAEARVVERLLASPEYAERWARHWMDVWRYSDWYGRRHVPDWWNSAPQVWRWRDWIVASLRADKGYDRMVQEMLAADEIAPADDAAAVATGYLARNWYALNQNHWMREIVEHTGKAFLGLTFNCAHCHDHKYDPISQREYFQMRAFFEPLHLRQSREQGEPDPGPFQEYEYSSLRKVVTVGSIRVFDKFPERPTFLYAMGDERSRFPGEPKASPGVPAFLGAERAKVEPVSLPPEAYYPALRPWLRQTLRAEAEAALAKAQAAHEAARQALPAALAEKPPAAARVRGAELALEAAAAALATAEADLAALGPRIEAEFARCSAPDSPDARRLRDEAAAADARWKRCAAVEAVARARQEVWTAEQAVKPGDAASEAKRKAAEAKLQQAYQALAAVPATATGAAPAYRPLGPEFPRTSTGRRAALARWLTDGDNPLTARVAVNHVWKWHFGRPLVETVSDFGRNGKPPSHPELLDWLAVEFREHGWSLKHLHRLIVLSRAYRLRSEPGPDSAASLQADPNNRWLWHFPPQRMEAEVVRDSLLHLAGDLERRLGGPAVEGGDEMGSRRRGLYHAVYPEEGGQVLLQKMFDAPDPCDCYRRTESIVPQQALALSNGRLVLRASRRLAGRLWAETAAAELAQRAGAFVEAAFTEILGRAPSAEEARVCREFLDSQATLLSQSPAEAAGGKPDPLVPPPAADPAQRAREGLVRVLFNHNDFVTIR